MAVRQLGKTWWTLLLAVGMAGCQLAGDGYRLPCCRHEQRDIVHTARVLGKTDTFVQALEAAGLTEMLTGSRPYTVFAPSDEAFVALGPGETERLLAPAARDELRRLLEYHLVPGRLSAQDLARVQRVQSQQGALLAVQVEGQQIRVGTATVIKPDIACGNGMIHVVDNLVRR